MKKIPIDWAVYMRKEKWQDLFTMKRSPGCQKYMRRDNNEKDSKVV